MKSWSWMFRGLALAAAAAAIPACGGGSSSSSGGGATVILSDGFGQLNAPDPAEWTTTLGGGSVAQDAGGSPGPSVAMTGGNNDTPNIVSVDNFTTPTLTIAVAVSASGTPALKGSGIITVNDAGNAQTATATWDAATGNITFVIEGDNVTVTAPAADGAFTTIAFKLTAAGVATWTMGGTLQLTGVTPWVAGTANLTLGVNIPAGGSNPVTFRFDNVAVTTP